MSEMTEFVGARLRSYRVRRGWSQEKLAELAGCHPTYIGQLERGEKNATLESIAKIAAALEVPLSTLLEKAEPSGQKSIPLLCYEMLCAKPETEQKRLYRILLQIEQYKADISYH